MSASDHRPPASSCWNMERRRPTSIAAFVALEGTNKTHVIVKSGQSPMGVRLNGCALHAEVLCSLATIRSKHQQRSL
jgi:hypothetical protein